MNSLNLVLSQRSYLLIPLHYDVRAFTYEFWRDTNIQCITDIMQSCLLPWFGESVGETWVTLRTSRRACYSLPPALHGDRVIRGKDVVPVSRTLGAGEQGSCVLFMKSDTCWRQASAWEYLWPFVNIQPFISQISFEHLQSSRGW